MIPLCRTRRTQKGCASSPDAQPLPALCLEIVIVVLLAVVRRIVAAVLLVLFFIVAVISFVFLVLLFILVIIVFRHFVFLLMIFSYGNSMPYTFKNYTNFFPNTLVLHFYQICT